ncbi:hypothetical protein CTH30272_03076 [Allocatenococcus thiocycli]|nr:hypothetical protein CTH30272_03076 [Catenococcus thiocycli]
MSENLKVMKLNKDNKANLSNTLTVLHHDGQVITRRILMSVLSNMKADNEAFQSGCNKVFYEKLKAKGKEKANQILLENGALLRNSMELNQETTI